MTVGALIDTSLLLMKLQKALSCGITSYSVKFNSKSTYKFAVRADISAEDEYTDYA